MNSELLRVRLTNFDCDQLFFILDTLYHTDKLLQLRLASDREDSRQYQTQLKQSSAMKKTVENLKRVRLVLNTSGKYVLKKLLLTKFVDEQMIYRALQRPGTRRKFEKAVQKGIMTEKQWNVLYPNVTTEEDEKNKLNSKAMDTDIYTLLIRKLCDLEKPADGWNAWPRENDSSTIANVIRIKMLNHDTMNLTEIPDEEFEDRWRLMERALVGLGYSKYAIDNLRTCCVEQEMSFSYLWFHIVNSPELHREEFITFLIILFVLLCIVDVRECITDKLQNIVDTILWNYYKYIGGK